MSARLTRTLQFKIMRYSIVLFITVISSNDKSPCSIALAGAMETAFQTQQHISHLDRRFEFIFAHTHNRTPLLIIAMTNSM